MLTQLPLPLLPGDAREIAPGVGVADGPDGGGVVWVHGLATFAWDAGDEAARRLAGVQLWQLKGASQAQVAAGFGVIPVSVWRWAKALAGGGVAALIPDRKGPRRPSALTPQKVARIRELDGQGMRKAAIAAAAGVSETSVRNVPRAAGTEPVPQDEAAPAAEEPADRPLTAEGPSAEAEEASAEAPDGALPVLPDPVPRDAHQLNRVNTDKMRMQKCRSGRSTTRSGTRSSTRCSGCAAGPPVWTEWPSSHRLCGHGVARARSTFLSNFPTAVLGISSMTTTWLGSCHLAKPLASRCFLTLSASTVALRAVTT